MAYRYLVKWAHVKPASYGDVEYFWQNANSRREAIALYRRRRSNEHSFAAECMLYTTAPLRHFPRDMAVYTLPSLDCSLPYKRQYPAPCVRSQLLESGPCY